jgi:hypothetical protein
LALGDKENMLSVLLPFAKKKQNDFWVWQVLAEAFANDDAKRFACFCKALSCKSPEEMLVNLRQKMAGLLITKGLFKEAKTEIELLVKSRTDKDFTIPNEVVIWQNNEWYKTTTANVSNFGFYRDYTPIAEALLFSDVNEETIIVEFVNSDKKVLYFIASDVKFGFLKYDRFLKNVRIGDVLKVRFQSASKEGLYKVYTAINTTDNDFKLKYFKEVSGVVAIPIDKAFGFLNDIYIHPSLVSKYKLTNGATFTGNAIKSYSKDKKQWSWKLV